MAISQSAFQSMLDAIDIVSSARAKDISYDRTIVCTIVDNSRAKDEFYYTVSDGSVKFKAYVISAEEATRYQINDQVYVTIPLGNYNNQKFINGYYISKNNLTAMQATSGTLRICAKDDNIPFYEFTVVNGRVIHLAFYDVASNEIKPVVSKDGKLIAEIKPYGENDNTSCYKMIIMNNKIMALEKYFKNENSESICEFGLDTPTYTLEVLHSDNNQWYTLTLNNGYITQITRKGTLIIQNNNANYELTIIDGNITTITVK